MICLADTRAVLHGDGLRLAMRPAFLGDFMDRISKQHLLHVGVFKKLRGSKRQRALGNLSRPGRRAGAGFSKQRFSDQSLDELIAGGGDFVSRMRGGRLETCRELRD